MSLIRTVSTLFLAAVALAGPAAPASAGDVDPRLRFLLHAKGELGRGRPGDLLRGRPAGALREVSKELRARGDVATAGALNLLSLPEMAGSIRFHAPPSPRELLELEALGVRFTDFGAGPAGSATVYPARMPWEVVLSVADHPSVLRVASGWRLGIHRPLARSRPEVQADPVWTVDDPAALPVTGEGVLVADFDSGVNYFHPAFFFPDGGSYAWLDVDRSGGLTAADAVDLDRDGVADPGEGLSWLEAGGTSAYGNSSRDFDPRFDWLFNDANGNSLRDYGASFGEAQPGYGERVFLAEDLDGDDKLEPGEPLTLLGSSKFRAIRNRDGSIHARGVDLLSAELDEVGHGTGVSGILVGGAPGGRAMSGIAPGAEMIHAVTDYTLEPPFLVPIEEHLAWAASLGADIFLIEDGEWTWESMDGSSNVETLMDELARDQGILQVVPAGNLSTGNMHTFVTAGEGMRLEQAGDATVAWPTLLWRDGALPAVTLTVPEGASATLEARGTPQRIGGYEVYSAYSLSPRGTHRLDVRITSTTAARLSGGFRFAFPGAAPALPVHGYFYDDASSWSSNSRWAAVDPQYTVTWPATADSAVSVAAYNAADGSLDRYSGWGPRIDGESGVDITAPGSNVTSTSSSRPGNYSGFGGTSGAGPHVAGAAALMRQYRPDTDNETFREALAYGALEDGETTDPDRWGAGKLRAYDALTFFGELEPIDEATPTPEPDGPDCQGSTERAPGGLQRTMVLLPLVVAGWIGLRRVRRRG